MTRGSISHTHSFQHTSSGELNNVVLPQGGRLRWAYRTFTYTGNKSVREVQNRYLKKSSGASETTYPFTRDDAGDAGRDLHLWTRIDDPSGPGGSIGSSRAPGTGPRG